jgi:hypothetical protein
LRPHQALEALGQLGAVEEVALACFNGAEGAARRRTDGAGGKVGLLVEGAVLLRFLAVVGEGLGEILRGRGRVRMGGVVDLCRASASRAIEGCNMDYGLPGVVRLPRKRIMGWRPCWRSVLVAFIVTGGSDFGADGQRLVSRRGRLLRAEAVAMGRVR